VSLVDNVNGAEWACNADHDSGSNFITEVAGHNETENTRFWELEQNTEQIVDVQGRLKGAIEFWKTVLKASSPVIECIQATSPIVASYFLGQKSEVSFCSLAICQ